MSNLINALEGAAVNAASGAATNGAATNSAAAAPAAAASPAAESPAAAVGGAEAPTTANAAAPDAALQEQVRDGLSSSPWHGTNTYLRHSKSPHSKAWARRLLPV